MITEKPKRSVSLGKDPVVQEIKNEFPDSVKLIRNKTWSDLLMKRHFKVKSMKDDSSMDIDSNEDTAQNKDKANGNSSDEEEVRYSIANFKSILPILFHYFNSRHFFSLSLGYSCMKKEKMFSLNQLVVAGCGMRELLASQSLSIATNRRIYHTVLHINHGAAVLTNGYPAIE